MADENNLNGKVALDTTAFKKGVSDLNSQIKSIETGFRASAAVMGEWSKSSEGLTARTSSLSEKLALQKQKLETLHQEYDALKTAEGDNSKAMESIANQMYSAEKAISSTESELGKYNDKLKATQPAEETLSDKMGALNRQAELSSSQFRVVASSMGDWESKSEGLRAKIQSLSDVYATQSQKVKLLQDEYEKVAKSEGESSKAAQELAIKINSEKTALTGTTTELSKYSEKLKATEQASSSFADKIKGKFADMGSSLKSAFSTENIKIALGAVGAATAGFLQSAIGEAKDAEKANADLEQSIKSTGGAAGMTMQSLNELTSAMVRSTTYSDDEIKSGEGMLLTFTNIGKDVFPQVTTAMLDFAQKMGTGPKEAALALGKALNDPATGLSKLSKQGVTFTEEQKNQIKAMQKAGDTAGAQKLMLAELNKEFGGQAAAAAGTYEGKQKQLANTMKDLKETIGTAMLPVLMQLANAATKILVPLGEFISEHPKLTAGILTAVAAIGTLVGGMSMVNTVASGLGALGIAGKVAAILPTIGLVGLAVAGVAVAAALIITHWSQIKDFFKKLWEDIKGVFSGIGDWFSQKFTAAKDGVVGAWSGITGFFSGIGDKIGGAFAGVGNAIKIGLTTALSGIGSFFSQFWANLTATALSVWEPIKTGLSAAWNGIKEVAAGAWELIKTVMLAPILLFIDLVTGNFGQLKIDLDKTFGSIRDSITLIWNGIVTFFTGIWGAISGGVQAFWTNLKTGFEVLWADIKAGITTAWNGFKNTIVTLCGDIKAGIVAAWNGIINWFKELPGKLKQIGIDMFTRMKEGVTSTVSAVGTAAKSGITSAFTFIKNLPSDALQWGKDIINGIVKGIKAAAGAVSDAVKGIAQDIRKFLHFSVPDEGPLADFDEWMPDMMHLMADGITDNAGVVTDAVKQTAGKVADGINKSKASVLVTAKDMSVLLADEETRLQNKIADIQSQTATQSKKNNEEVMQDNLNAQLKLVQDFKKQYDDAIAAVEKEQADMSNKLLSFGDLFTKTQSKLGDTMDLGDLQSQIDAINGYGDALEKLKARGVSDTLMDKIKDMSIEDATQYTTQLLSMTDEQYAKYMLLWDQKQQASKSVAEKFYKGELDSLKASFVDKIPSELSGIKDQMQNIGVLSGQGLAAGFASQSEMITSTFVDTLQTAYTAAKESMDIHSPSRKWAYIGEQNAAGLGVGFVAKMKSVTKQIADSIPLSASIRTAIGTVPAAGALPGSSQSGSLDNTNALVSAMNMVGAKIVDTLNKPVSMSGGSNSGDAGIVRTLWPAFIDEAARRGLIDASGYIKIKAV